jgi:hypothetical protein
VGFSGSRHLPPASSLVVRRVVAGVVASGLGVAVGCAAGADAFVRSACLSASVFYARSRSAAHLARRSVALVRAVAASGPGAAMVGFPVRPCPVGLSPSAQPGQCFCGLGSGTWASLALAAGLGLPVVVFCPAGALPASWGSWSPVVSGAFAGGWLLCPAQPRLL